MTQSKGERVMHTHLRMIGVPFETEYKFARELIGNPKKGIREALSMRGLKDWRFDFALPDLKIAIEIEGGVFVGGRHNSGVGFTDDCKKYNAATLAGWRLYRFTTTMVKTGEAHNIIKEAVKI